MQIGRIYFPIRINVVKGNISLCITIPVLSYTKDYATLCP